MLRIGRKWSFFYLSPDSIITTNYVLRDLFKMLNFSQTSFMSTIALLSFSFSVFANTGQDDHRNLNTGKAHSTKSNTNLVELYKVKAHATEHIKGIEAKLSATDEAEQEELLVELAQSLLYYQDRHNKASDAKAAISKGFSVNGASGKASKVVNPNSPYATNNIYRKALNAYKKASKLSLNKNRIKYTRELSELAVKLQNKNELVQIFVELLQHGGDEKGTYLAHIDYADGLVKFKDDGAEKQFLSAINMREPVDGVEANYRYAYYLLAHDKPSEALSILDKFTFEERKRYIHVAMLRQKTMHQLKLDTENVDSEIEQLRQNLSKSPFVGSIPKFTEIVNSFPSNSLNLPTANAYPFAHNNETDDSRSMDRTSRIISPKGYIFSPLTLNVAEVIYNEARGARQQARYAIGWAIRNRATIDMNGADFYHGTESDPSVNKCREATPYRPYENYLEIFKQYSCVVHGGTTRVGSKHSQMNDDHVDLKDLEPSGIIWDTVYVLNGWVPDPTVPHLFLTDVYPYFDFTTGNPEGAQEWQKINYCAKNYAYKIRLGNVGGDQPKQEDFCPQNGEVSTDNFFWGRKPSTNRFDVIFK